VLYKDAEVPAEEEDNQECAEEKEADRTDVHHVGLNAKESLGMAPKVSLL
jgi:hypothetical protein